MDLIVAGDVINHRLPRTAYIYLKSRHLYDYLNTIKGSVSYTLDSVPVSHHPVLRNRSAVDCLCYDEFIRITIFPPNNEQPSFLEYYNQGCDCRAIIKIIERFQLDSLSANTTSVPKEHASPDLKSTNQLIFDNSKSYYPEYFHKKHEYDIKLNYWNVDQTMKLVPRY